jgi:hypothetical protein
MASRTVTSNQPVTQHWHTLTQSGTLWHTPIRARHTDITRSYDAAISNFPLAGLLIAGQDWGMTDRTRATAALALCLLTLGAWVLWGQYVV